MNDRALNIQGSFDETMNKSDLADISINLAEIGLDSLTSEGILKDIPIVNTIASFVKFGANIHDRLFLKKILSFLQTVNDVPPVERMKMIKKIDDSRKYRIKVGEKLLYIIDSCEDHESAELVGRLFRAFLNREIDYDDFVDSASIIKGINSSDLKFFLGLDEGHFSVDEVGNLIGTGLLFLEFEDVSVYVRDEDDYKTLREGGNKYISDVDGGKMWAHFTHTGEIIRQVLGN